MYAWRLFGPIVRRTEGYCIFVWIKLPFAPLTHLDTGRTFLCRRAAPRSTSGCPRPPTAAAARVMGITPRRAAPTDLDLHGGAGAAGGPDGAVTGRGSPWLRSPPVKPAHAKQASPATRSHRRCEHPRRRDWVTALLLPPSIQHAAMEIEQQPSWTRRTSCPASPPSHGLAVAVMRHTS